MPNFQHTKPDESEQATFVVRLGRRCHSSLYGESSFLRYCHALRDAKQSFLSRDDWNSRRLVSLHPGPEKKQACDELTALWWMESSKDAHWMRRHRDV